MNIKKMLIISFFLLILASMAIGTSFAVSSEKINIYKSSYSKYTDTFDKKIASIDKIVTIDAKDNRKNSYKISIKKNYQKTFKIDSVKCKYLDNNYKTYNGKNKTSLIIKPPENYSAVLYMVIKYQTKNKIKNESTNLQQNSKYQSYHKAIGKTANITLKTNGYTINKGQVNSVINYQKFYIKTVNKKYKIKSIKTISYYEDETVSKTMTFRGNGKTTFTKVISGKGLETIGTFKVTYY